MMSLSVAFKQAFPSACPISHPAECSHAFENNSNSSYLAQLSCLGLTEDSFYRTANSEHFEGEKWKQWTSQRAFVALYVASHRGHSDAVQYLLEHGNSGRKLPIFMSWDFLQVERTEYLVFQALPAVVSWTCVLSATNQGPHGTTRSLSRQVS